MTPDELYNKAKDLYYRVFPFDKGTKKSDMRYIRVGIINNPNDVIKWNFYDGERLLSTTNFDKADVFIDGQAIVTRNHEMNVLNQDGAFVFDKWYYSISRIGKRPGTFIVSDKLDEWGLRCQEFVYQNNSIDSDYYSRIFPLQDHDGLCVVTETTGPKSLDHKDAVYNYVKKEIISDWYDSIMPFFEIVAGHNVARVRNGEMYNLIRPDGQLVFDIWSTKNIIVQNDGQCQLFDNEGKCHNLNIND